MAPTLRNGKKVISATGSTPRKNAHEPTAASDTHPESDTTYQLHVTPQKSARSTAVMVPMAAGSPKGSSSDSPDKPNWEDLIQLLVGKDRKPRRVHKAILTKIPWFRNCLRHDYQEAQTGQIEMPDDDPEAVSEVINFAYHERMTYDLPAMYGISLTGRVVRLSAVEQPLIHKFLLTIMVYVLARKFDMEALQNIAVDMLRKAAQYQIFLPYALELIDRNTVANDKLRLLAMDCIAYQIKKDGWRVWTRGQTYKDWMQGHAERSEMVMEALANKITKEAPWRSDDQCHWHVHISSQPCPPYGAFHRQRPHVLGRTRQEVIPIP